VVDINRKESNAAKEIPSITAILSTATNPINDDPMNEE
jgi:hypothetical protein